MNCLYITLFFNIVTSTVQTFIKSWNQLLYPRVIEVCRQHFEPHHDFFLHLIIIVELPLEIWCMGDCASYMKMMRCTNLMQHLWFIIINISTCLGHLYAHLQEYRLYVIAYGVQHCKRELGVSGWFHSMLFVVLCDSWFRLCCMLYWVQVPHNTCYARSENSWHYFVTFCRFITLPKTATICLWISAGRSPFALRNRMTERTSHLVGLWIGAAVSNTSHSNKVGSTTVKRARLTGKGSRSMAVLP